jgi:hypothetical protein
MDVCPKCKRNLLSHSSARCNWCGEVLTDPDYVEEAEASRAAYYARERLEAAVEMARIEAISPVFGTGIGGGVIPMDYGPLSNFSGYVPRVPKVPDVPLRRRVKKVTEGGEFAPPAPDYQQEEPETLEEETRDRASHIEF